MSFAVPPPLTGAAIKARLDAVNNAAKALHSVSPAANRVLHFTGSDSAELIQTGTLGRALLDDANAAEGRATLDAVGGHGDGGVEQLATWVDANNIGGSATLIYDVSEQEVLHKDSSAFVRLDCSASSTGAVGFRMEADNAYFEWAVGSSATGFAGARDRIVLIDKIAAAARVQVDLLGRLAVLVTRSGASSSDAALVAHSLGIAENAIIDGILFSAGGRRVGYEAVSTSTTLDQGSEVVEQTASGITTDLWASPVAGDVVTIFNTSGGANTIDGNGNNIGGSATKAIADGVTIDLIFNGTEWKVLREL